MCFAPATAPLAFAAFSHRGLFLFKRLMSGCARRIPRITNDSRLRSIVVAISSSAGKLESYRTFSYGAHYPKPSKPYRGRLGVHTSPKFLEISVASDTLPSRTDDYFDNLGGAGDGTRTDVGALSDALFPMEVTENTLLDDRSAPALHQDMVMRQSEQQAQARDRAEQQRPRAEWEAVMAASRAAQRDGSVDFSGTTEPFPDHDQAIVGAGLTVY